MRRFAGGGGLRGVRGLGGLLPVALALAATTLVAALRAAGGDPATDAVERRLVDLRFALRGPSPPPETVAIVAIDERAALALPGPDAIRSALADALPLIFAHRPRAVAVDLVLADATPADARLAAALSREAGVVLGFAGVADPAAASRIVAEQQTALDRSAIPVVVGRSAAPAPAGLLLPTPRLALAAGLGHVNVIRSPDRLAREMPLVLADGSGRLLPALPLAAAASALGERPRLFAGDRIELGPLRIPLDRAESVTIDHVGGPGAIRTFGLLDILEGKAPPGALAGRVVLVGATAESLRDTFATPLAPNLSGVEVHAAVAASLLSGETIRRGGAALAASAALALALAALVPAAAAAAPSPALFAGLALGLWLAAAAALQAAFAGASILLDGTTILAGLLSGSAAAAALRLAAGRRRARRLARERTNLARFVSPALADLLARRGRDSFPGGAQKAAILFVDVVGFTARAARATPEEIAVFLAVLHRAFERAAARRGGVVVDFQGDGALVAFGFPEPRPDDAARALRCAEDLAVEAASLPPGPDGARPLLWVTTHYGEAAPAILGGEDQSVATLAGDAVNLASRLQEIARAAGRLVLTTRETLDAAGDEPAAGRYAFLARETLRGRDAPTEIWAAPDLAPARR